MNNNHLFVDLPILLLRKIICSLENYVDRICFTLVCKKYFNLRDRFLQFKSLENDHHDKDQVEFTDEFNNIFIDTVRHNSYRFSLIKPTILHSFQKSILTLTSVKAFKKFIEEPIENSLKEIYFKLSFKQEYFAMTEFYNKLLNSKVSTLIFDSQLIFNVGCLPPNIKSLTFSQLKKPFEVGSLPEFLEELIVTSALQYNLDIGVLPLTLKKLSLGVYPHEFLPGVLPKNLEELEFEYTISLPTTTTTELLPPSLRIINGIPTGWMKYICSCKKEGNMSSSLLPNLTHLSLKYSGTASHDVEFTLDQIPSTVLYLKLHGFNDESTLNGKLPSTVTSIEYHGETNVHNIEYSEEVQYEYIYFSRYDGQKIPNRVHELVLVNTESIEPHCIPNTVEILRLQGVVVGNLPQCIPQSVRLLDLENTDFEYQSIGDSGEYLFELSRLPSTIREIIIPIKFISMNNPLNSAPLGISSFSIYPSKGPLQYQIRRIDNENFAIFNLNTYTVKFYNHTKLNNYSKKKTLFF